MKEFNELQTQWQKEDIFPLILSHTQSARVWLGQTIILAWSAWRGPYMTGRVWPLNLAMK